MIESILQPEKKHGFPNYEEEATLKTQFFDLFGHPARALAQKQVPDWEPTYYQMQLYLSFLYGIFFYDFVAHGRVLNGYASCNNGANRYRDVLLNQKPLTPESLPLDRQDLFSWPLRLINDSLTPWANIWGIISVGVKSFTDEDPRFFTKHSLKDPPLHTLLGRVFGKNILATPQKFRFISNLHLTWVLAGIEEAQHTDFNYLERLHYGASGDQLLPMGPLKSLKSVKAIRRSRFYNKRIDAEFDGLPGYEYAAHIVQMRYVELYSPELWQMGFKDYDQLVRSTRRQKLGK